jgi:hypothetical protein
VPVGIAANALNFAWNVRATVGIGAGGFAAGASYELITAIGLAAEGNPEHLHRGCVQAAIDVKGAYGIGYSIPDYVLAPINAILGLVRVKPIPASGGPTFARYPILPLTRSSNC